MGPGDSGFNPFLAWVLGVSWGGCEVVERIVLSVSRCEGGCPKSESEREGSGVCVGGHMSVIMAGSV